MFEPSSTVQTVHQDVIDTDDTIMVAISGFTVLVWDHLVTFDDEVELIWKRDKGFLAYLFLINRYLTPLGFIVNLVAFTLPSWGTETCRHFVRYEGAMTVIGTQIAGLMMFLRIRAIYNRKKTVVWSIMTLFLIWLGVNAWLLTYGEAVPHVLRLQSCTMIFDPSLNNAASASAWLPLLYDTCIFALTLYKTRLRTGHIIRTVFSDGILYYSVICMVNVVLTVMIVRAGPGVKNIAAQLELLLTVAMMSRITLNLRKEAVRDTIHAVSDGWTPSRPRRTVRGGSGSARKRWTHSTLALIMPQRDSIVFRSEPSYPELIRFNSCDSCPGSSRQRGGNEIQATRVEQNVKGM